MEDFVVVVAVFHLKYTYGLCTSESAIQWYTTHTHECTHTGSGIFFIHYAYFVLYSVSFVSHWIQWHDHMPWNQFLSFVHFKIRDVWLISKKKIDRGLTVESRKKEKTTIVWRIFQIFRKTNTNKYIFTWLVNNCDVRISAFDVEKWTCMNIAE